MIYLTRPYLTKKEAKSAYNTVLSHWLTQGARVEEFEKKFASYVGAKYAVAVTNCTTALHLSFITAGIGPGDEVICPSLSFIATANAIIYVGAKPVFSEVEFDTYNLDPKYAEKLITSRTKALLIVHQLGMPADIDVFTRLARKYNLKIIEDAACAAGSVYKGKKIGSHSSLVCFSFHPRKVITTGEGGMITTSNKKYFNRLRLLRQHAMSVNDRIRHLSKKIVFESYPEVGYNYKMTDIQAAIGTQQIKKLDWLIQKRRQIAKRYRDFFSKINYISLQKEDDNCYSNYQTFSIYLDKKSPLSRNMLMQKLLDAGISTRRASMAIHRERAYKNLYKNFTLPVTERLADRSLSLPLYAQMKHQEIDYVISKIADILKIKS